MTPEEMDYLAKVRAGLAPNRPYGSGGSRRGRWINGDGSYHSDLLDESNPRNKAAIARAIWGALPNKDPMTMRTLGRQPSSLQDDARQGEWFQSVRAQQEDPYGPEAQESAIEAARIRDAAAKSAALGGHKVNWDSPAWNGAATFEDAEKNYKRHMTQYDAENPGPVPEFGEMGTDEKIVTRRESAQPSVMEDDMMKRMNKQGVAYAYLHPVDEIESIEDLGTDVDRRQVEGSRMSTDEDLVDQGMASDRLIARVLARKARNG
jgi:hypothetical protein